MRRLFAGLLLLCSIAALSVSVYSLAEMFRQERKDDTLQEQLKEIYENTETEGAQSEPDGEDIPTGQPAPFAVDEGLLALHEENPDCIGWLAIPDTIIDYPVMYRPEEENYYLHRDFHGDYNANGCLFVSEICDPETSDNLIVYGHHMNSGKMFAALEGYKDEEFYRGHARITFNTLHGEETYQVIAAFSTPVYTGKDFAYYTFSKAGSRREFQSYVQAVKKKSFYETGETADYGDRLLTLSTCEYSQKNGRMVVVAKRITEGGL